jgi:hypothetical protein
MNVKINFKETFLNELKKSNIKLCDFCQQKKLNPNLIDKILIKSTWFLTSKNWSQSLIQ